jgi:hypothetical protein
MSLERLGLMVSDFSELYKLGRTAQALTTWLCLALNSMEKLSRVNGLENYIT